jgi:nitroreductase
MNEPTSAREIVRPLLRTRQVRQFTDEPVADELLDAIADVARWSGSSTNSQPWRFLVLRDTAILRRLRDAGMPQLRSLATATAAIAIVMPEEEGRAISYAYDEARAAERMLIAATMLDLGAAIAWVMKDVRPVARELLGLPASRTVRTLVALGHPTEEARRPRAERGTARLPREETVFYDRWPAGRT